MDGGLAALLEARRRPVHPRAWLNQLAHASAEALEASVEYLSSEEGVGKHVDWKEVVGAVAAELLSLAGDDPDELRRIQRETLAPLERDMMQPIALAVTPGELMRAARAAILYALPAAQGATVS